MDHGNGCRLKEESSSGNISKAGQISKRLGPKVSKNRPRSKYQKRAEGAAQPSCEGHTHQRWAPGWKAASELIFTFSLEPHYCRGSVRTCWVKLSLSLTLHVELVLRACKDTRAPTEREQGRELPGNRRPSEGNAGPAGSRASPGDEPSKLAPTAPLTESTEVLPLTPHTQD